MNSLLYKRIRAFSIDTSGCFFLMLLLLLGFPNLDQNIKMLISAGLMVAFYLLPYLLNTAQTFGKRTQRIRIMRKNGSKAGILRVILRDITKIALFFGTAGVYGIISLFVIDESGRGPTLHDAIFGTVVVDLDVHIDKRTGNFVPDSLKKRGL